MDLESVREIVNAHAFAVSRGMGPTVHLTVRWSFSAAFVLRDWVTIQGRLLDKMHRWLHRNGVPVSFVWVREMGRTNGPHTHILLHLAADHWAEFKAHLLRAGAFDPDPDASGEALVLEGNAYGTRTARMRAGHLRYVLKSLNPNAIVRTGRGNAVLPVALGIRPEPHSPLSGKLCGASYTLGPTARSAAGWTDLRTTLQLAAYLHP